MNKKNNEEKVKMKITIKIGDESEFTAENISERLEELEEIKHRLEELQFILPDEMTGDIYDKWDDVLDDIGEHLDEIESLIEEVDEEE